MKINAIRPMTFKSNQNTSPAFKGQQFPSGYYEDDEIYLAKQYINQVDDTWREKYKNETKMSFMDAYGESHGINYVFAPLVRPFKESWEQAGQDVRTVLDLTTGCLWEIANFPVGFIEAKIRQARDRKQIDEKTARVATLICDLQKQRAEDVVVKTLEPVKDYTDKQEQNREILERKNALYHGFIEKLEDENIGKLVEFPNVIMVESKDAKQNKELLDYVRKESTADYKYIADDDSPFGPLVTLSEALEIAKTNYEETGRRTLIEVENFGKLIKNDVFPAQLEAVKDLMSSCSEDFHSTIIFKTDDSSDFIDEAMAPHRIGLKVQF